MSPSNIVLNDGTVHPVLSEEDVIDLIESKFSHEVADIIRDKVRFACSAQSEINAIKEKHCKDLTEIYEKVAQITKDMRDYVRMTEAAG